MTNLEIDHLSCWMLKIRRTWMCRACCQHLWNYKNIGHSFHHIDLWIACRYDPGSTSSVHPSSKLRNYVILQQTPSILLETYYKTFGPTECSSDTLPICNVFALCTSIDSFFPALGNALSLFMRLQSRTASGEFSLRHFVHPRNKHTQRVKHKWVSNNMTSNTFTHD